MILLFLFHITAKNCFMRKVLFCCFFAAVSFCVHAQIRKGSIFLGGGISFGNQKIEMSGSGFGVPSQTTKLTIINPAVGIAIKDNLIIGINLTYSDAKQTVPSNNNSTLTIKQAGGGLFIRKYFPIAERFYLFGEGGLGYLHQEQEQIDAFGSGSNTNSAKGYSINLNLYPGVSYAITKRFFLELGLNNLLAAKYESLTLSSRSTYSPSVTNGTAKTFSLTSSLSNASEISIGARFILGK